ncbi:MAG: hypothetical protein AAGB51_12330 [Planctomycetota bacterium]
MQKTLKQIAMCAVAGACCSAASAQGFEAPAGGVGPDVITAELTGPRLWGSSNGVSAYSIGTTSCNIGDVDALWDDETNDGTPANLHPVIAQNFFKVSDGRITQIGQSWLKHSFFALQLNGQCGFPCDPAPNGNFLGPGCSDPYSSTLNGDQRGLGAKFEINAATGEFPWPFTGDGVAGASTFKRLQVPNTELDPSLNPGARYFAEAQYVSPDDAQAGNDDNNASYREFRVTSFGNGWNVQYVGSTQRVLPAILSWQQVDSSVETVAADIPNDGRFWLAYNVTDNGDGTWRYEYAVQNLNSHRSADAFIVPVGEGATITNVGFRDVDYHSGEPFDSTDWSSAVTSGGVVWSSPETHAQNPNTNALRWGTLYNFWFDADTPPEAQSVLLDLFRPDAGGPSDAKIASMVPSAIPTCPADVNLDGSVDDSDFFAWVTAFTADPRTPAQESECDVNLDSLCTDSDFFAWVTFFTQGGC